MEGTKDEKGQGKIEEYETADEKNSTNSDIKTDGTETKEFKVDVPIETVFEVTERQSESAEITNEEEKLTTKADGSTSEETTVKNENGKNTKQEHVKIKNIKENKSTNQEEEIETSTPSIGNSKNEKRESKDEQTTRKGTDSEKSLDSENQQRKISTENVKNDITTEHELLVELVKIKVNELTIAKRKNRYLNKTLIEYFKNRKTDDAYSDERPTNEVMEKYHKRTKMYKEMKETVELETERKLAEVAAMREECEALEKAYDRELIGFLNTEIELGKIAIDSRTGKPICESTYQQLVQRHHMLIKQIQEARLKFIKLQYKISGKENVLKSLDLLGGKFHLIDYEQLKMDNQNYVEKIEERDNELSRLKSKLDSGIRTTVEISKDSNTALHHIENLTKILSSVESKLTLMRESVTKLKQKRDNLRKCSKKLMEKGGLLFRPKLVTEYEESVKIIEDKKSELNNLITKYNEKRETNSTLRKTIEDNVMMANA